LGPGILSEEFLNFRYKGSDKFSLVSESYPRWEENFQKVMEITRELYWEAKRAP
jgi:hypothetical protein